ncbi:uncharacterized protein LOC111366654 [Olea europaea var. sylvestris]|uniref:uncharacterized protein LOC111366654 n=1 Tax=Olea europaea var. sylvestris TaxID=158386 RepID=UPI000C1CE912|nr:uncharacterized protein LOC111366654 [Olea europaea var. sylvestris]
MERNKENVVDQCIYLRVKGNKYIFLVLYVDDILLAANDIELFLETKCMLSFYFDMKDLGEASYVLGIQNFRNRSRGVLGLSQKTYINRVLIGYSDADFANLLDDRRSNFGCVFMMAEGAVSWKSVKQTVRPSALWTRHIIYKRYSDLALGLLMETGVYHSFDIFHTASTSHLPMLHDFKYSSCVVYLVGISFTGLNLKAHFGQGFLVLRWLLVFL